MLLYVIVDAAICDAVATARSAAAEGANFIQLRYQDATDAQYSELALEVMVAIAGTDAKFIVGERPHLVPRLGAAGVHIGEKYRDIQTAREEIGAGPILGVSQFTPAFIAEHLGEDFPVDYLSVGPVWTTVSKADAGAAIGVAESVTRAQDNPYHSALIGGITAANAGELTAALGNLPGAMIVVLGEVCRAADPAAAVRALRAAINA
jgi:thiamine-phosphate diphosphorylase